MNILNYITWNIDPEIFSIGPLSVRWYGLLFALGFVLGQQILSKIYVAEGRTEGDVDVITLYMIIGTVVQTASQNVHMFIGARYAVVCDSSLVHIDVLHS